MGLWDVAGNNVVAFVTVLQPKTKLKTAATTIATTTVTITTTTVATTTTTAATSLGKAIRQRPQAGERKHPERVSRGRSRGVGMPGWVLCGMGNMQHMQRVKEFQSAGLLFLRHLLKIEDN